MQRDDPPAPLHDEPDNEDFGTTEGVGQSGYPEEEPREAVPGDADPDTGDRPDRFDEDGPAEPREGGTNERI